MGLRRRFLLAILAVLLASSAAALAAFVRVVDRVARSLGSAYARQYALASRALLEEPLERELALARRLADSPVIRAWAREETDAESRRRAFAELESYRREISSRSWFYVVHASLGYHYDNDEHPYGEGRLAYVLDPAAAKDSWYFATIAQVTDYALNVNYDAVLDLLKVWFNVVIREPDGSVLGVTGTGIDLTEFLRRFVDRSEAGVECIVLDERLAIQAHPNPALIDYHSIAKPESERSTVSRLLDRPEDLDRLRGALAALRRGEAAGTVELRMAGRRRIVGVTYVSSLDWYVLTAIEPEVLIGRTILLPVAGLGILCLILVAGVAAWTVDRMVLRPLAAVASGVDRMASGDLSPGPVPDRPEEIAKLARALEAMGAAVRRTTEELEGRVRGRTAELDASNRRLQELVDALEEAAITDPQTGLLNRRGMVAQVRPAVDRVSRGNSSLALFLLDVDRFKDINDTWGHEAGDRALVAVAHAVRRSVRSYDLCARWGGEEFLVAAPGIDPEDVSPMAEKLREVIMGLAVPSGDALIRPTASVGACVVGRGESLDGALARADRALYRAKQLGRNRSELAPEPTTPAS